MIAEVEFREGEDAEDEAAEVSDLCYFYTKFHI